MMARAMAKLRGLAALLEVGDNPRREALRALGGAGGSGPAPARGVP